ncbi:uncharacterized protein F4812DRAFT_434074 [Daldinia caldariorum]|uniref:uncharacterized protein n=1 Tax=Daldinia caldariorum TaxID=326644 RepID=UPI00200769AD|nr:uncharacterized protein F4812DRAFT_434074 [Daldinia caldariorum]KAI1466439.1 hypothetical protein F4812DRAFT_434074 [Daldinia caldariorum]
MELGYIFLQIILLFLFLRRHESPSGRVACDSQYARTSHCPNPVFLRCGSHKDVCLGWSINHLHLRPRSFLQQTGEQHFPPPPPHFRKDDKASDGSEK